MLTDTVNVPENALWCLIYNFGSALCHQIKHLLFHGLRFNGSRSHTACKQWKFLMFEFMSSLHTHKQVSHKTRSVRVFKLIQGGFVHAASGITLCAGNKPDIIQFERVHTGYWSIWSGKRRKIRLLCIRLLTFIKHFEYQNGMVERKNKIGAYRNSSPIETSE